MALWYRASSPTSPISSIDTAIIPNVQSSDFRDLLSYDQPITDAIITDYLTILWKSHLDICFLDTNFHTTFMEKGWDTAFNKFFLHKRSSSYAHKTQFKPTLHSPTIIIPQHVQGSHWVSLIRRIIDNKCYFLYADDMNSSSTAEYIESKYSTAFTSPAFQPDASILINCVSFTYHPHSNECGP